MSQKDALTDSKFWDKSWGSRRRPAGRKLSNYHPYFGENGIFLKMVRKKVGSVKGLRILELGGGGQNFRLLALYKMGAKVTALDFSPVALQDLDAVFKANNAEVELLSGDFMTFDFEDKKFDLVVHWGVMEHFTEIEPLMALTRKVLAPNGKTLFSMPNMEAKATSLWEAWSPENYSAHYYHPTENIATACDHEGFKLDHDFYYGFPFLGFIPFEKKGILQTLVSAGQWLVLRGSFIFPFFDRLASPKWSAERGFLVYPKES